MHSILKRYIAMLCTVAVIITGLPVSFAADELAEDIVSSDGELLENSWRYEQGEIIDTYDDEFADYDVSLYTASDSTMEGIDVSHHNGKIDWAKVKSSGKVDYAIIRCGYGKNYEKQDDSQWTNNVKGCIKQGIPFGVYLYSYATSISDAKSEAEHVLRLVKGYEPTFPIYYDMEDNTQGKLTSAKLGDIAETFCNAVLKAGYSVGIYANKYWWTKKLTDSAFDNDTWYKWVAQYADSCTYKGSYTMWQYTSKGKVSGISGNVDKNHWYGSSPDKGTTVPSNPTITSAEPNSTSSITVKWNSVSGATKYRVERRKSGTNTKYEPVKTTTNLEYTDTGLSANTVYYYKVYAINGAGSSNDPKPYQTRTKLNTPEQPTVDIDSDTQLTITWNKVSGADKYKVQCHIVGKNDWDTKEVVNSGSELKYVHNGLKAGTEYYYRIIAVKTGVDIGPEGDRSQTNIDSDCSKIKTKFTRMKIESCSPDNNNPTYTTLKWNAVTGESGKTYTYNLYRDGALIKSGIEGTSYTDTEAGTNKIHQYRTETVENGSSRGKSLVLYAGGKITNEITLTPQDSTSMKISWTAPSGAPEGTKYIVRKWSESGYYDLATTTSTSYVDTNLSAGSSYAYYIQVRDLENKYVTSTYDKEATLDISPSSVSLSKSEVTLTEGESIALSADIQPDNSFNKSVTWSSSDSNVAAVDNGVVTAIAAGSTNITVTTSNGKTASCTVTVNSAGCTEHEYGEWIIDTEATCEQSGSRHRVCEKCGRSESEVILATGHSYSEEWQTVTEATCTTEGEEARICSVCGAKTDAHAVATTEHSFGEWQRDGESTCSQDGTETRTCSVCGFVETQVVEAKDHDYELTVQTEATSDGPGSRTYTCTVCGDTYTEEYVPEIKQGTISVTADKTAPEVGSEVVMAVAISDNPGMSGFRLSVNYDKNVLTPKSITPGDALTAGSLESNLNDPNVSLEDLDAVWAAWENNEDISDNGVLFNVTFTVKDTAPDGTYAVTLNYDKGEITTSSENAPYYDIMPDTIDEYITISDLLMGDVNLDRSVNSRDGVLLLQYLAHWNINLEERNLQAADVYTDQKITIKDGVKLSQMLAGYKFDTDDSTEAATVSLMSDETAKIEVQNGEGLAGESVYVPVTITDNPGIAAFNIKLNYDSDYLTPVSVTDGDMMIDGSISTSIDTDANSEDTDSVTILWNDSDNMSEDGTLFMVEFLVSEDAQVGQKLPITISTEDDIICDQNLNTASVEVTQGEISVVDLYSEDTDTNISSYYIDSVEMRSSDGTVYDDIPLNGNFELIVSIGNEFDEYTPAVAIAVAYTSDGHLIGIDSDDLTETVFEDGSCNLHINATELEIAEIKVFVWDSIDAMTPLADTWVRKRS